MMIIKKLVILLSAMWAISASAQFSYQDSILYLTLLEARSTPILDAKISFNGVEMLPCQSCPYRASNAGVYYTSQKVDVKFNQTFGKAHLRIEHPDYQLFDDSIFVMGNVTLLKPGEEYIYNINKMGAGQHTNTLVVIQGKESLEELKKIGARLGCTYVKSINACPDFKFDGSNELAGHGPIEHFFTYEKESDRVKFAQKVDRCYPVVMGSPNRVGGLGLSGHLTLTSHITAAEKIVVEDQLKQWKRQGIVKNWEFNDTYAMLFIYLEPGQERLGNEVIESILKCSYYFAAPHQELVLFNCPG